MGPIEILVEQKWTSRGQVIDNYVLRQTELEMCQLICRLKKIEVDLTECQTQSRVRNILILLRVKVSLEQTNSTPPDQGFSAFISAALVVKLLLNSVDFVYLFKICCVY